TISGESCFIGRMVPTKYGLLTTIRSSDAPTTPAPSRPNATGRIPCSRRHLTASIRSAPRLDRCKTERVDQRQARCYGRFCVGSREPVGNVPRDLVKSSDAIRPQTGRGTSEASILMDRCVGDFQLARDE